MNQSLQSELKSVSAKLQAEQQPSDGEPMTFHDKQLALKAKDPDNLPLQTAIALGKDKNEKFLQSVRERNQPDHRAAVQGFNSKFGMDSSKSEAFFIQEAAKELKAAPYETQDPAYEAMVLKKYEPTGNVTREIAACYDNFCAEMKAKWFEAGYTRDKFAAAYTANIYGLIANDTTIEMKGFEPKQ